MSLQGFVDSPTFYSGVELSATDLNDIANNIMILDSASRRKATTHYIHREIGTTAYGDGGTVEGNWLWRGGFLYRIGMTTARFVVVINSSNLMSNLNKFQVLFDGTVVHEQDVTIAGTFNIDIPINSRGYTDYQIVDVLCQVSVIHAFPTEDIIGTCYVYDAYTFPLDTVSVGINPTLTSFGQLTQSRLNDLSNKVDYMMGRIALVPNVPHHAFQMIQLVGFGPWEQRWLYAKLNLGNNATHIRFNMYWFCYSLDTRIEIVINGVTKIYGPFSPGDVYPTSGILEIPASDFGMLANTDYLMTLKQVTTIDGRGDRSDRLIFTGVEVYKPIESSVVTLDSNDMLESIQFSNLQSRLNTYITAANTIYTTLSTNTVVWNRAQMFRGRMAMDDFQDKYWEEEMQHRLVRYGDILWVRGKNIKLCYGIASYKAIKGDEEEVGITREYEQTLTSNNVETKIIYLDTYQGLYPGTEYFLRGEVHFASEYLR
jgi:hypothetical protein